jgi:hypothetical protein
VYAFSIWERSFWHIVHIPSTIPYTKNVNTADSFLQIVYTYILRQELECVENAARKIPRSFFTPQVCQRLENRGCSRALHAPGVMGVMGAGVVLTPRLTRLGAA